MIDWLLINWRITVSFTTETYDDQVLALFSYTAQNEDELTFYKGSVINVISKQGEWWRGEVNGNVGLFPFNYVQNLSDMPEKVSQQCKWFVHPEYLFYFEWIELYLVCWYKMSKWNHSLWMEYWNYSGTSIADMLCSAHLSIADTTLGTIFPFSIEIYLFTADTSP